MAEYLFDQAWARERHRLDALGRMYDAGTIERLARTGVCEGWSCLEVGAGSGTVARWMAEQVGPSGRVLATDIDPRFLQLLGSGIQARQHDISRDALESSSFDLIHARAVLQHVPGRDVALDAMVAALRPGGWLVLEDIAMPHPVSYPPLPTWAKALAAMEAGLRGAGADPYFGLRLPSAIRDRGLAEISSDARVPLMFTGTESAEFVTLSIEQVAERLIESNLLASDEVEIVLGALRSPGHVMPAATMITVSARRQV